MQAVARNTTHNLVSPPINDWDYLNPCIGQVVGLPAYEVGPQAAPEVEEAVVVWEEISETLHLNNIELRLDFQLGDDDLQVSLLVESLEAAYQQTIGNNPVDADAFLGLQSAKEWVSTHRHQMAGLFRYLKSLTSEQL